MSSDMKTPSKSAGTSTKRVQQKRAEQTKTTILDVATDMFSTLGYDGVSVRALETAAGVQRGAVSYHFDGKEALWKAMFDRLMDRFAAHFDPLAKTIQDLDKRAGSKALTAALIRFSAETPEFNRLMMKEGGHDTWRMAYIVEQITQGRLSWITEYNDRFADAHDYYIRVGAATFVFGVQHECKKIFGVDPSTDEFIKEHAARVSELLLMVSDAREHNDES